MDDFAFSYFDMALGRCAIAWRGEQIRAVSLPEIDDRQTAARLFRRAPGARESALPAALQRLVEDINLLTHGAHRKLLDVKLDLSDVSAFDREVLKATRQIGLGETKTYGEIAIALGDIALSRRVGQALGRNPFPIIVPCHRVVGADGKLTGFSAPGGVITKERLLKIEGALAPDLFDSSLS